MSPLVTHFFSLLLFLAVSTTVSIPTAPTIIFCPSGDTALLEGRHDRPFKCGAHSDCPAGFDCRLLVVSGGMAGGVCCPDLAKLNLIYGEPGQQPEQKTLLELTGFPHVPSYADYSVMRNRVEQRTLQWRARALAANSPWLRPHWTAARKLLDREKYSCKRQRLDYHCNDKESRVRRQTQFVVRWYFDLKEEKCLFYPWGYCTGEPIASDSTLRTREECEILCTPPAPAATDTTASTPVLGLNAPISMAEPSWSSRQMSSTNLPTLITTPASSATTEVTSHIIPMSQTNVVGTSAAETPVGCERSNSYRSTCTDGLPSQFTLRFFLFYTEFRLLPGKAFAPLKMALESRCMRCIPLRPLQRELEEERYPLRSVPKCLSVFRASPSELIHRLKLRENAEKDAFGGGGQAMSETGFALSYDL